ncbi:MAG: glycerophosphodiester phosphodiesterase family protein, partial [Gordonia sp. (in: high G+C Gram-positive bacteria)]
QFGGNVVLAAKFASFDVLSPDVSLSDTKLITAAHAVGLKVIPWTVNEPADMRKQISYGVDGLITDYPTRLRALLATSGKPLPQAFEQ